MGKDKKGSLARPSFGDSSLKMVDVAREAGVAVSTVSRALAYPDRINKKTRDRVLEAASRLGYTPNLAARNLRLGSTRMVLIVLPPRTITSVTNVSLRGIDKVLMDAGYSLIIGNLDREVATERHILGLAQGGTIDGAIVLSSRLPVADGRSLRDVGIPIVGVHSDLSGDAVPSIISDERAAMAALTRHFLALGHRSFFYISGPSGSYHDTERAAGIADVLDNAGPGFSLQRYEGDYELESGRRAAEHFLSLASRPTAVLAANDEMAMAFLHTVRLRGLDVPGDVAVSGFDGVPMGDYVAPNLTSVRQPFFEMGQRAASTLLAILNGDTTIPLRQTMSCTVLIKQSSAPGPS